MVIGRRLAAGGRSRGDGPRNQAIGSLVRLAAHLEWVVHDLWRVSVNAKFLRLLLIAVLALCMGAVAACGDDDDGRASGGSDTEEAASTPEAEKIKIGMVTDIGGLNDRASTGGQQGPAAGRVRARRRDPRADVEGDRRTTCRT